MALQRKTHFTWKRNDKKQREEGNPTHKPPFGDLWSHDGADVHRTSRSRARRGGRRRRDAESEGDYLAGIEMY